MPWKSFTFADRIESRFLFRTALSKSILPFALHEPNLIVLPLTIETDNFGHKKIKLHSATDLLNEGFLNASRWFKKTEKVWVNHKTEKSKNMTTSDRLDFQRGVIEQSLDAPYLVLYNSSAKDANSTIIKREDIDFEFIIDYKTYWFSTTILEEAHYLCAIFNSTRPNEMMKEFQSRGLFGARDVSKKILDIYYPRYDASDATHVKLAELSEQAHVRVKEYLATNPPQEDLTPMRLGKLRLDIKRYLIDEMHAIDNLVEKIIK